MFVVYCVVARCLSFCPFSFAIVLHVLFRHTKIRIIFFKLFLHERNIIPGNLSEKFPTNQNRSLKQILITTKQDKAWKSYAACTSFLFLMMIFQTIRQHFSWLLWLYINTEWDTFPLLYWIGINYAKCQYKKYSTI